MYREYTIPQQKCKTCGMCQHHDNRLLRSGRNPIREHYCTHPNFEDEKHQLSFRQGRGRLIGKDSNTPNWCPFLPQKNGKRKFSQITPDECLHIAKIAKSTCFFDEKKVWKVKKADRDTYNKGGYIVKSKDNWFEFAFDFETEDVEIWDTKNPESDCEKINIENHYKIVQFLNSKNIYFSWQSFDF